MAEFALPVLFTVFLWWFATGAILYLDGMAKSTYRWSIAGAAGLFAIALFALQATSSDVSVQGAYIAFTSALVAWGFNEMLFLMGYVTGPRRVARDVDARGWPSFRDAALTIWHHELALAATALIVLAVTWGGTNLIGIWTFALLWLARLSTKFNAYLGVPNMPDEFLPDHLSHLATYIPKKPMNLLFPMTVTAATIATAWLGVTAYEATAGSFERTGCTLLATLAALAVLEHWFLVIPLPAASLWKWGMKSRASKSNTPDAGVRFQHLQLGPESLRATQLVPIEARTGPPQTLQGRLS